MKSQNASSRPTKNSEFPFIARGFDESKTSTAPGKVIYAAFPLTSQATPLPDAIDIDDLVAEFEQSPESARAISDGRRWVAENFFADKPITIALLRLQKGWSQAELAKRADTSQPHIARLELGRVDPQLSTVRKIAKALGVTTDTLTQAICPEDAQ
mgnify:CR=1 FL=1